MTTMTILLSKPVTDDLLDSLHIAKDLGMAEADSLMCAFIPELDDVPNETIFRDMNRAFVLYSSDGIAIDMLPVDKKACKWWMVKEAARENHLSWPEVIWQGNAGEFSLEALPSITQPDKTILAIRDYSNGPWIKLQKGVEVKVESADDLSDREPAESRGGESSPSAT